MRRFLADTFAMLMFSTACGIFIEVVVAGLSVEQSLRVRLAAVPVILLSGRCYGLYRDALFHLLGRRGGALRSTLLDVFANTSFQAALYATLLVLNGVHGPPATKALLFVVVLSVVAGRPYGLFLTWVRRLFGSTQSA